MKGLSKLLISVLIFIFFTAIHTSPASAQNLQQINNEDLRISGPDRYATAIKIAQDGWKNGADTVVLARGDLFADALSGVPLAKKENAPILLSRSKSLNQATKDEIKRLKPNKIILLGSVSALSQEIENELKSMNITIKRIKGSDRYETSLNIAKELNTGTSKAIIATGQNFPDALSIAPYAAIHEYPIILTKPSSLTTNTKSFLSTFSSTLIVGGTAAVSTSIESALPKPERIYGNTRYETAVKIHQSLFETNKIIYLSTGANFSDALTGAALASKNQTSVLIVPPNGINSKVEAIIPSNQIKEFKVFGGKTAVPDSTIEQFSNLLLKWKDSVGAGSVSETTKLLPKSLQPTLINALKNIKEIGESDQYVVPIPTGTSSNFTKGSIYLVESTKETPTGFMFKVEKVESNRLTISEPTIDEVMPSFSINTEQLELTPDKLVQVDLEDGVTLDNYESGSNFKTLNESLNFEPLKFAIEKSIDLKQQEESPSQNGLSKQLKFEGELLLKDLVTHVKLKKDFGQLPQNIDLEFGSKQEANLKSSATLEGNLIPSLSSPDSTDVWKVEGVDREGRIPLAALTYAGGAISVQGPWETDAVVVPLGITVFITATIKADGKIEIEEVLSWKSELDVDVALENGNYVSDSELNTTDLSLSHKLTGEVQTNIGLGVEPAINFMGVLPLLVQNDLSKKTNFKGFVSQKATFLPTKSHEFQGCFELSSSNDITSILKTRLKTTANLGGDVVYSEEILKFEKELFKKELSADEYKNCDESGSVTGSIVDAITQIPLENIRVNVYKSGQFLASYLSQQDGSYTIELKQDTYDLVFTHPNYKEVRQEDVVVTEDGVEFNPVMHLIKNTLTGVGTVSGNITDATNGEPLNQATLSLRTGINNTTGDIFKTLTTNQQGLYKDATLPVGYYTVEIKKSGYISNFMTLLSLGPNYPLVKNGSITPELLADELRVVLTWGEYPRDLDSHLKGTFNSGESFHIYFANKSYYGDSFLEAFLDIDDTDSFGPETVTLYSPRDGKFEYFVHDYSAYNDTTSNELSSSEATVHVYSENRLVRTFYVPTNKTGIIWNVFKLENGIIIPVNTLTNDYIDADIFNTLSNSNKNRSK
ncbi:cell wall-binding repeat-containing protein [Chryseomicrobium palamuruense]